MTFPLIRAKQTPYQLLAFLASGSPLVAQVMDYFKPRCDCDIADWLKQRILAGDQTVIAAIKSMIAKETVTQPDLPVSALKGASGDAVFMLRSWCQGSDLKGEFVNNDNTTYTATVSAGDASCV
jgi:SH3-like domain-containing protein